nr:MAG TPA: hypothetical protein [Caudoviricetes sp.]
MKISQIRTSDICNHIREIECELEDDDLILLETMKKAAIRYCCTYTGLEEEELDKYEDITVAFLMLIADMWDNRSAHSDKPQHNFLANEILSMHATNLIPSGGV